VFGESITVVVDGGAVVDEVGLFHRRNTLRAGGARALLLEALVPGRPRGVSGGEVLSVSLSP